MPRWFLSYHSPDEKPAAGLKSAIQGKDPALEVFFAPTHLRAGGAWTAQLAEELAKADAFILLIGKHGVGKWQVPEYDEALDRWVKSGRTFPLIVVLIEGQTAPGLPFLRQLHWIVTPEPASEKDIARIFDAALGRGAATPELWRHASPYRGLEAMEEKDNDFFFGRTKETVEALNALAERGRLPIIIGNSGVGKSSLAQAGVLAALKRQAWPDETRAWPAVFENSRQWCFLTLKPGAEPIRALTECFFDAWQYEATDPKRVERQIEWIKLLHGEAALAHLIDATERRLQELDQPKPPAFFLYVDQGEELYARAGELERRRFSELLAEGLRDPRLRVMMSMRSDFLGFLQRDAPLFNARRLIETPPLGEDGLREVVSRPAEALGARFDEGLIDTIVRKTAEDSVKDVGALPLLSYTLDDMWTGMVRTGDGVLRLPMQSFALDGVLVDRANAFLEGHPSAEESLRRLLTLKLATVHRDSEPTRRRAPREEFSDEEWRLVTELADYPNRLLVTATNEAGETYGEVAHETIFRRWDKLRKWIEAEREFLIWRSGLEAARKAWEDTPAAAKGDALLMGFALTKAQDWLAKREKDIQKPEQAFIAASRVAAQRRRLRALAPVAALVVVLAAGAAAWWQEKWVKEETYAFLNGNSLKPAQERALKPGGTFKECRDCPEMVVVPATAAAKRFMMGSPEGQGDDSERPRHEVNVPKPFAVAKFELTFDEWDACEAHGDCAAHVSASGWGRGRRPAINVSWDDAQTYVNWLSRITGQTYRLLSEAEYEYATRAGSETTYPWGDDIKLDGKAMANCAECGSPWDGKQTAPVCGWQDGACLFSPNRFGLYDMVGNVWEWTEDCWNGNYKGAPADGSRWTNGDCNTRVVRGGSWNLNPDYLRSAYRLRYVTGGRDIFLGFRVARTLTP